MTVWPLAASRYPHLTQLMVSISGRTRPSIQGTPEDAMRHDAM